MVPNWDYVNPQETYGYYSLPVGSTRAVDSLEHRYDGLGEVLEGNDLISSGLRFRYTEPESSKICSVTLDSSTAAEAALSQEVRGLAQPSLSPWREVVSLRKDLAEREGQVRERPGAPRSRPGVLLVSSRP